MYMCERSKRNFGSELESGRGDMHISDVNLWEVYPKYKVRVQIWEGSRRKAHLRYIAAHSYWQRFWSRRKLPLKRRSRRNAHFRYIAAHSYWQVRGVCSSVKTSDSDAVRSKAAGFAAAAAMAAQTTIKGTRGSSKDEVIWFLIFNFWFSKELKFRRVLGGGEFMSFDEVIDSALEASEKAAAATLAAFDVVRRITTVVKSLQELWECAARPCARIRATPLSSSAVNVLNGKTRRANSGTAYHVLRPQLLITFVWFFLFNF